MKCGRAVARGGAAGAVLAAASFGFLASGAAADRAAALVSSWQLFPRLSGFARGAAAGSMAAGGLALAVLALSALFGRWYCAVLCPLGALQDLTGLAGRKRRRYRRPATASRIAAAIVAALLLALGATAFASWLDPWSLFGRFLSHGARPLFRFAAGADLPGFDPWAAVGACAAMAAILVMAARAGRWFCGSLCPVGSALGLLNRIAPLRLRMEASACVGCGACASICPASCIDPAARRIDDTRCVYCLACVGACPTEAIRYGRAASRSARPRRAALGPSSFPMTRMGFLAALGGGAAALALSALPGRSLLLRLAPATAATTPPGSLSAERFLDACTACGLCASRCPSGVLVPSLGRLGPRGLFVPSLDYSVSYCQYGCTTCLELCPCGALARMTSENKKLTKIGDATLVKERCIIFTQKTKCGACAEHCPTGAVRMVMAGAGIPEPLFTSSICIGCGACHHACPAKPERAITVAGLAVHRLAERPTAALLGAPAQAPAEAAPDDGSFPF